MIPSHEVWHLLTWLSGRPRAWWMSRGLDRGEPEAVAVLWPEGAKALETLIARRAAGVPLAHLLGEWSFYGRRFFVNRHTLIPRADSEPMVEAVLSELHPRRRPRHPLRLLDLGTGTGCLLLSVLADCPTEVAGVGVDQSRAALAVARANGVGLGIAQERLQWLWGSWLEDAVWQRLSGLAPFDVVLCNPPYLAGNDPHLAQGDLPSEPRAALAGLIDSADGLHDVRVVLQRLPSILAPGAAVFLEHGWTQREAVLEIAAQAGFQDRQVGSDLEGRPRWVRLASVECRLAGS